MAGLVRVSKVRHGVVAVAAGGVGVLGATGAIGGGVHPERYDGWHVVIAPAGAQGIRLTTTIDHDFGDADRHGPLLRIDNDLGTPQEVRASSPDAPADVQVIDGFSTTEIRIGDPDETVTGQHRYVVTYTLPAAVQADGHVFLDVLNGDEFETDVVTVVLTGFDLAEPRCVVGEVDSADPCELIHDRASGLFTAEIGAIGAEIGVSLDAIVTATAAPVTVAPPPIPERRGGPNELLGAGLGVLGVATAVPVYAWARRRGRNEVFAGGAADAAFGELPAPGAAPAGAPAAMTRSLTDDELAELATTEFSPPEGIEPWAGRVLLTERYDDSVVEAFLSGLAGHEALELREDDDDKLVLASGPKLGQLPEHDARLARALLVSDPYTTGNYDPKFAAAWSAVDTELRKRVGDSGWWKQMPPGRGLRLRSASPVLIVWFVVIGFGFGASAIMTAIGLIKSWPMAVLFALAFPAAVAYVVYRGLLPARTARGSALALRAESFRRFLEASEGRHVEWAWQQGLLREYSAWAVALDAADAWSRALAAANVPEPARASATPLIVRSHSGAFRSARTKPSSSTGRSRAGGGFRGGRVGGGGGGVSRGSW